MTHEQVKNEIVKQIEYYFGDINLPKDKFLKNLTGEEDGWISINTLLTFKRLKTLAEKFIATAIESSNSDLLEVNVDTLKIRRKNPLPEIDDEFVKNLRLKTVHIKGFPKEAVLDDIISFCSRYGEIESVQMRRFEDKTFKGCIFAIFKSIESAEKAINSNDKFKDEFELNLRENKVDYFQRKKNCKLAKKENKLVKLNANENKDETNETEKVEQEITYENGCILKLVEIPENLTFKDIKPKLLEHATVQYVDIFPESHHALIRFASKAETEKALKQFNYEDEDDKKNALEEKKNDNEQNNDTNDLKKIKIDNFILKYKILEGDDEKDYWKKIMILRNQSKDSFKNKKNFNKNKKGNKRSAGGYHNKNKSKKAKVDN